MQHESRSLLVRPNVSEHCIKGRISFSFNIHEPKSNVRPALVASLLIESSASALARTGPHRQNVVEVESALPFASTSTTENWTAAKSFEVMRRSDKRKGKGYESVWIVDRWKSGSICVERNVLVAPHLRGT